MSLEAELQQVLGLTPTPREPYVDEDGIEVWNPVYEPSRKDRWSHFRFPKTKLYKGNPDTEYMMFVYKRADEPEFYFFSNDVAWCLGYEDPLPHEAVQMHVPKENQKRIDAWSGIFLTVQGVRDFINVTPDGEDKDLFVDWFEKYLEFCTNNDVIDIDNNCPA